MPDLNLDRLKDKLEYPKKSQPFDEWFLKANIESTKASHRRCWEAATISLYDFYLSCTDALAEEIILYMRKENQGK